MKRRFLSWIVRRVERIAAWAIRRLPTVETAQGPVTDRVRVVGPEAAVSRDTGVNPWLVKAAIGDFMNTDSQAFSLGLVQAFEESISVWQSEVLGAMQTVMNAGGSSDVALKVVCCNLLAIGMYCQKRLDSANAVNPNPQTTVEGSANA